MNSQLSSVTWCIAMDLARGAHRERWVMGQGVKTVFSFRLEKELEGAEAREVYMVSVH